MRRGVRVIMLLAAVLVVAWGVLAIRLNTLRHPHMSTVSTAPIPNFSHVFVIMMENHSVQSLTPQDTPYIHRLMQQYGTDSAYYGVTHVSLPNYVALLSGRTFGTHSDNPTQIFPGPNLAEQLQAHHISWQAVMQSDPSAGYQGNWYPDNLPTSAHPATPPPNALYAKKHNPFALFKHFNPVHHIATLSTLHQELLSKSVPKFVWITPNLCHDMHGQVVGPGATCPETHPNLLLRNGDKFLAQWVPAIMHSKAWTPGSVIFITWDEAGPLSLTHLTQYLSPGPGAPRLLGMPIGGGPVPLIVITHNGPKPIHISLWADHYSLLKTIEAGWHLPYLGHAAQSSVPLLSPFFGGAK